MSAMEKAWNAAMRWYSRWHHQLAQDWPRLDGLCHMVFYYCFFAITKIVIFLLKFRLHPHFFTDHLPTSYEYAMDKTDVWSGSHR